MLKLLYQSLRALEKESLPNRLVRCVFELKSMVINGEYPDVFSCMDCKKEENLSWLDVKRGGMYCVSCKKDHSAIHVEPSVLYTLQYIITSTIEKLYTFTVSEEVLFALERILKECRKRYMDKTFKSLQVLEENQGFADFL